MNNDHQDHQDHHGPGTKGRRGPISSSCAECRRLKIKCQRGDDGEWPCNNCGKRGLALLCPNDTVPETSRRGEASLEALKRKNKLLTQRVKELEAALATVKLHAASSPDSQGTVHSGSSADPGLDRDESIETEEAIETLTHGFGSLKIVGTEGGRTLWHGSHAPSESFIMDESNETCAHGDTMNLPMELMILAFSFPMTSPGNHQYAGVKETMRSYLPPFEEIMSLLEAYFTHSMWLGSPVTRRELLGQTIMPAFKAATWEEIPPERLALLFAVLTVGTLVDCSKPQYDPMAFRYQQLTSACLTLARPLEDPSFLALQAIEIYLYSLQMADSRANVNRFWIMSSIAFRMATALGIHRKARDIGWSQEEETARRRVFWQLATMDTVVSVAFGRPRFFNTRQIDCPLPEEDKDVTLPGVAEARYRFVKEVLAPVVEEAFTAEPITYAKALELDRRVRQTHPAFDRGLYPTVSQVEMPTIMSAFCVVGLSQISLMYMHRGFFYEAFKDSPQDPTLSKFRYSFLAVQQTSARMVGQVRHMFATNPVLTQRLFFLWMHLLSAVVALGAIVIRAPTSSAAQAAMLDLDLGVLLFEEATSSRRVRRALPTVLKLREKARAALFHYRAGEVPPTDQFTKQLLGETTLLDCTPGCQKSPSEQDASGQGDKQSSTENGAGNMNGIAPTLAQWGIFQGIPTGTGASFGSIKNLESLWARSGPESELFPSNIPSHDQVQSQQQPHMGMYPPGTSSAGGNHHNNLGDFGMPMPNPAISLQQGATWDPLLGPIHPPSSDGQQPARSSPPDLGSLGNSMSHPQLSVPLPFELQALGIAENELADMFSGRDWDTMGLGYPV